MKKKTKRSKKDWSLINGTIPRPVGHGVFGKHGPRRDRSPIGLKDYAALEKKVRSQLQEGRAVHAKEPADMYICRHTATCDSKGKGGKDCPHSRQHLYFVMCDAGCGFHTKPTCAPAKDLLVKPAAADGSGKEGCMELLKLDPGSLGLSLNLEIVKDLSDYLVRVTWGQIDPEKDYNLDHCIDGWRLSIRSIHRNVLMDRYVWRDGAKRFLEINLQGRTGSLWSNRMTFRQARDFLLKYRRAWPVWQRKAEEKTLYRNASSENISTKPPADNRGFAMDVVCPRAVSGECDCGYNGTCKHAVSHRRDSIPHGKCNSSKCYAGQVDCVPEHIADERKKWAECRMAGSDKVAKEVAAHEGGKPAAESCRIRFRLEKWERALVFQVLHMDERFRAGKYPDEKSFTVPFLFSGIPSITVVSMYGPRLLGDGDNITHIHLRGSEDKSDLEPCCMFFSDNPARDRAYTLILNVLRDWSCGWKGFREIRPERAGCGEGVFEF